MCVCVRVACADPRPCTAGSRGGCHCKYGPVLAKTATSITRGARPRYGAGLFCFDCVKLCNAEHLMGLSQICVRKRASVSLPYLGAHGR